MTHTANPTSYPDDYIEGIRLFNTGDFWHAHEKWEACWLGSDEPDYTFYKGIIQSAAALYHWRKGTPHGLHRNWVKSRTKLVPLLEQYKGVDVAQFIAAMDDFVVQDPPPSQDDFPRLRFDT